MRAIKFFSLFLSVLFFGSSLYSGNTGKIAGRVVDKSTGEPLIGVNVLVVATNLGAATDEDGFYYILQIPPETYNLEFTYIGYHTLTVKNVRIKVDLTQNINVNMESEAVEGPTIEVVAEQVLVQKDITATRRTASRQEIEETPGFQNTTDIFLLQGGSFVNVGAQSIALGEGNRLQVRDESLKDVHVRGGRGGEILYMVDGVPVTHPLYGGRDVLNLNVVDVQEMELLTGAFSAEYGQAQSGVVNITTRTGGDKFQAGVEYKSSELLGNNYDFQYTSFYIGGPEPITMNLIPKTGIKLPGKLSFFLSGNATLSNTPYNNQRAREKISLFGFKVNEKQDNIGNLNAKLNWDLSNLFSMIFSYHGSWNKWTPFEWGWKNIPDQMVGNEKNTQNLNFSIRHTLSKSTFYNLNLGYLYVDYDVSLNGMRPPDFWKFYKDGSVYDYWTFTNRFSGPPDSLESTIQAPGNNIYGFVDSKSFESDWRDDVTHTFSMKGDITSQIHPEHLVKGGIELKFNDLHYIDIKAGGVKLSNYGNYVFNRDPEWPKPPGPYPEFAQERWFFHTYPTTGGVYVQDKFEKETLIINAGIRFDWIILGTDVLGHDWKLDWAGVSGQSTDWKEFKYKFSPRFGISFPITQRTVLFFSYGHFTQLPEMQFFYRDPYSGGVTGNPHLDFEQTVLYEFGFTHQLAQDWAFDIKSYAKDISGQVGTILTRPQQGYWPAHLYDNLGYARARGLEFQLIKRYSNFISGKASYTVQWANGYSSSAFDDYIRSLTEFPNPIRERPLDWDIRHQIIFQMSISAPQNKAPNLFGLQLPDNWTISVLSRYASGQPYTPYTLDPAVRQKTENSTSAPFTATTDLKILKSFELWNIKFGLFTDIFNIFNQKNVRVDYGFNTYRGKPYIFGDIDPQLTSLNVQRLLNWYDTKTRLDLRQFDQFRQINLGLRIDW